MESEGVKALFDRNISRCRDENGATTVEHGLMIALIAAICIAAVIRIGSRLGNVLATVSDNAAKAGSNDR